MKINELTIIDYNQFDHVYIDLTYPLGHPKEGKPLEKICIIGEGGTGKTTLLRFLKILISRKLDKINANIFETDANYFISAKFKEGAVSFNRTIKNGTIVRNLEGGLSHEEYIAIRGKYESETKPFLMNFPTDTINVEVQLEAQESINIKDKLDQINNLTPQTIVDFAQMNRKKIWSYLLKKINQHNALSFDLIMKFADPSQNTKLSQKEVENAKLDYENWISENPSPLLNLAKAIDPILERFGLKVKTDLDYNAIINSNEIQLQTISNNKTVNRDLLSTGTRQIIDTLIPLIELKPKNAFILFDEPERSLYPTLQTSIIGEYQKHATDCQMFFATHSPLIASSFDPWEIIELKFDENHQYVTVKENYEGERHVDNYLFNPQYLRWDEILTQVFGLTQEGNSLRDKEIMNTLVLKKKLDKALKAGKTDTPEYNKMLEDYLSSSKKLGWPQNEKN